MAPTESDSKFDIDGPLQTMQVFGSIRQQNKDRRHQGRHIGKNVARHREAHVLSESLRRRRMAELFTVLQSLLPRDAPKVDRCTVLRETENYINNLKNKLEELSQKKAEIISSLQKDNFCDLTRNQGQQEKVPESENPKILPHSVSISNNHSQSVVDVKVAACDAMIHVKIEEKGAGFFSRILEVLEQHSVEVLSANRFKNTDSCCFYSIHGKVPTYPELSSQILENQLYALTL